MLIVQLNAAGVKEDEGDYHYRCYAPAVALARREGIRVVNLTNEHRYRHKLLTQADILVIYLVCDPDLFPIVETRKERGLPTVFEMNDDVFAIPPWNPSHGFYHQPENLTVLEDLAIACDGVQFSSEVLARLYGHWSPHGAVFRNHLLEIPDEHPRPPGGAITVGWGGSLGHSRDAAELASHLIPWFERRSDVMLHLMCAEQLAALFDSIPPERKKVFAPGPLEDYYRFLQTLDVGLIPLRDDAYNRSRSDVKFLEYAANGVVPVVQAVGPYLTSVEDEITGFLFTTSPQMIEALDRLADDPALRRRVARSAWEYVARRRNQHERIGERIDFYEALSGKREARSNANRFAPRNSTPQSTDALFEEAAGWEGVHREGSCVTLLPTRFENLLRDGLQLSARPEAFQRVADPRATAARYFREAAALQPDNPLPWLYGAAGSDNPLESLQRAVTLDPSCVQGWLLLGREFARRRSPAMAQTCFHRARDLAPACRLPRLLADTGTTP